MSITGAQLISEVESLAKQAGNKYFYGGSTPATGFDCSGLIYDALIKLGYKNPPRTSEDQYAWVNKIDKSQLAPGDLVFAQFPGDNASPGHVGIYIGSGNVYSAQDPQLGIGISTLASWGNHIVGYGSVPSETTTSATDSSASLTSSLGGILSFPQGIIDFFTKANDFVTAIMWIAKPSNWLRIGAFAAGVLLLAFAVYALINASSDSPLISMPKAVPVPI